jgi:hypothetical protein
MKLSSGVGAETAKDLIMLQINKYEKASLNYKHAVK